MSGVKKWITGGLMGDYFTTAVRTGAEGYGTHASLQPRARRAALSPAAAGGISLLLIERNMPGGKVRKMETQFDNAHSPTMVYRCVPR